MHLIAQCKSSTRFSLAATLTTLLALVVCSGGGDTTCTLISHKSSRKPKTRCNRCAREGFARLMCAELRWNRGNLRLIECSLTERR